MSQGLRVPGRLEVRGCDVSPATHTRTHTQTHAHARTHPSTVGLQRLSSGLPRRPCREPGVLGWWPLGSLHSAAQARGGSPGDRASPPPPGPRVPWERTDRLSLPVLCSKGRVRWLFWAARGAIPVQASDSSPSLWGGAGEKGSSSPDAPSRTLPVSGRHMLSGSRELPLLDLRG